MSIFGPNVPWLNLTHNLNRFILLLSGIVFSVVLLFMFTGFKNALYDSQLEILKHIKGDIFIVSKRRVSLSIPHTFSQDILYQAQGYQGVKTTSALYLNEAFWKNPDSKLVRLARVIAFNLHQPLFDFPELQGDLSELHLPNTVWVDRLARAELGRKEPGTTTELADRYVRVVGNFSLGNDFASLNGNLIMSDTNYQRYFGAQPINGPEIINRIDVGIITLETSFQTDQVIPILRKNLPNSVQVMSPKELENWERTYWQKSSNIGFVFGVLTFMGFVIGVIISYQIIYADVSDHIREYATLKAIGFRNRFLIGIVFQESLLLATLGFIPGTVASWGLYKYAQGATGLIFEMTFSRGFQLFILTVVMCIVSGLIAMFKIQQSDPADIF